MTIGQLAKRAGVNPQTIRYYEREGILPVPSRRSGSDYREYSDATLETLRFIKNAQTAGFKLAQIREILKADSAGGLDCGNMRKLIQQRSAEVADKLRSLRAFQRSLSRLDQACRKNHVQDRCPGLEILHRGSSANSPPPTPPNSANC